MKDSSLQNESVETYEIGLAAKRIQWSLHNLKEMSDDAKHESLAFRFCEMFARMWMVLCLYKQKYDLAALLKNIPSTANVETVLLAGELLHELNDEESALSCFSYVIMSLCAEDQDMRLRALMGRLEIELEREYSAARHNGGIVNGGNTGELLDVIKRDIDSTSPDIRPKLKARLGRADILFGMIAIRMLSSQMKEDLRGT